METCSVHHYRPFFDRLFWSEAPVESVWRTPRASTCTGPEREIFRPTQRNKQLSLKYLGSIRLLPLCRLHINNAAGFDGFASKRRLSPTHRPTLQVWWVLQLRLKEGKTFAGAFRRGRGRETWATVSRHKKRREKEKMTQLQTKKVFKRRAKRGRSETDSRGKAGPLCSFLWAGTSGERERGSDKPSEFIDRFPSNPVSILPEWQVSGWELKPWIIHKITKPFSTLQPLNLMINFHQNLARRSSRISQVSTTQQSTHLPSMGKIPFACDKICKYAYMQICMCKCRMPGKTYTYI